VNIKTLDDVKAEFARRNAAKAAAKLVVDHRQYTHCSRCKHEFRRTEPTCFDSKGVPLCYDCSEGGVVS
jgi:hypothetical protein